jgi:hypothetical protein
LYASRFSPVNSLSPLKLADPPTLTRLYDGSHNANIPAGRQMTPLEQRIRGAFEALPERIRGELARQMTDLADEIAAGVAGERAAAIADAADAARTDADRAWSHRLAEAVAAAEQAAFERGRHSALAEGREEGRVARDEAFMQLLGALRALDAARSLGDILRALVSAVEREAACCALLLVKDGRLHPWIVRPEGATIDRSTLESGPAHEAARTGSIVHSTGATDPSTAAGLAASGSVLAVHILVGDAVVAVLTAGQRAANPADKERDHEAWAAPLEAITRHAARCLEVVTACRTAQIVASSRAEAAANAGRNELAERDSTPDQREVARRGHLT